MLRWFFATHEQTATMGASWWRLAHLPRAGGVEAQDAWLWTALSIVRDEMNRALWARMRVKSGGASLQTWRERVAQERG